MGDFLSFKNSFNSGDLITMLPGLQKIYLETGKTFRGYQRLDMPAYYFDDANHPIRNEAGTQVCMNKATFDMMKPLIESQNYIKSFDVWQGEKVTFDFDLTRHSSQIPLPAGDIHAWTTLIFPQLETDLSIPWLNVKGSGFEDKIIINRTTRYNNPYIDYFFLKEHSDKLLFFGTPHEYAIFCEKFNLTIPLLQVSDFLELAKAIYSCRFFIGNQSLCWHVSNALKKYRILEVCSTFPNCFPTGANGHSFVTQNGLEYQFNELLKKTE